MIYNKKLQNFDILKIIIEINQTTSYMLTFVFMYQLKKIVKVNHMNSAYCKLATCILKQMNGV